MIEVFKLINNMYDYDKITKISRRIKNKRKREKTFLNKDLDLMLGSTVRKHELLMFGIP